MKKNIHPELHDVMVECACGTSFPTRSTNKEIKVVICSQCHPFFTGTQKFVDTAGRIDKFNKKFAK
jgi:large subunit ribosomal protein L31